MANFLTKLFGGSKNEVDAALDSYEKYVDKMVPLNKKLGDGDFGVMSKLAPLSAKAAEFSDKLDELEKEMTAEQTERYNRIQRKLVDSI